MNYAGLDHGTQFKIFDRVAGRLESLETEESAMVNLMLIIDKETCQAVAENTTACEECNTPAEQMEWQDFDCVFICPDCGHNQ